MRTVTVVQGELAASRLVNAMLAQGLRAWGARSTRRKVADRYPPLAEESNLEICGTRAEVRLLITRQI